MGVNLNRRLLNTEKLIFKTESLDIIQKQVCFFLLRVLILCLNAQRKTVVQGGVNVLVTVEPEGVVALKNVQERELIIFNIGS